jgi:hypothetical protein
MVTVGLDLHKRYITACALDAAGTVLAEHRRLEVALADGSVRRVIQPPIPDAACTVSEQPRLVLVCDVEQTLADAWTIEDFDPAVPREKKNR